mmetsp:Transcript_50793/g.51202  ORF Transcript_50793/g.51202 Transcript_50793/m.51202 type:complete len:366 (-) Transcript_50793:821-1918(-)
MLFRVSFSVLIFILPETHASHGMNRQSKRCYAQVPVKDGQTALADERESLSIPRRTSSNNEGDIVHLKSHRVPRNDVVAAVEDALNGGKNFEVEFTDTNASNDTIIVLQDLTSNNMQLWQENGDLSGAFSVTNAFVKNDPDVIYEVSCPPVTSEYDSNNCLVTTEYDRSLVNCSQEESTFSQDSSPPACLDEVYDVTLVAIPPMPHFFISAVRRDADEAKQQQDGCPSNVGMDSANGIKKKYVVFENDQKDIQSHVLGSASLRDILQAEEDAVPLSVTEYDLSTETCAHYAQRIYRSLDIAETNELAQFVLSNIVENVNVDKLKKMLPKAGKGGLRALAAIAMGGEGAILRHLHELVYSQLDIKV